MIGEVEIELNRRGKKKGVQTIKRVHAFADAANHLIFPLLYFEINFTNSYICIHT